MYNAEWCDNILSGRIQRGSICTCWGVFLTLGIRMCRAADERDERTWVFVCRAAGVQSHLCAHRSMIEIWTKLDVWWVDTKIQRIKSMCVSTTEKLHYMRSNRLILDVLYFIKIFSLHLFNLILVIKWIKYFTTKKYLTTLKWMDVMKSQM